MVETVEQVEQNLRALVAEMEGWEDPYVEFYKRGVTGERSCAHGCVVANYLSTKLDQDVDVDGSAANAYVGAYDSTADVLLPLKVQQFIRAFDDGVYPELVSD